MEYGKTVEISNFKDLKAYLETMTPAELKHVTNFANRLLEEKRKEVYEIDVANIKKEIFKLHDHKFWETKAFDLLLIDPNKNTKTTIEVPWGFVYTAINTGKIIF